MKSILFEFEGVNYEVKKNTIRTTIEHDGEGVVDVNVYTGSPVFSIRDLRGEREVVPLFNWQGSTNQRIRLHNFLKETNFYEVAMELARPRNGSPK